MQTGNHELERKTAVVTGGSRGFGRGIVTALAAHGVRVLAVARSEASLAALKAEAPGMVETVAADVTDAAVAVKIIQRERPSIVVLNAGATVPIQETRFRTWETFSVNWDVDVKGTFTWAREALRAPLAPGSAIIVVSSSAAGSEFPAISGYIVAKTAQVALARCLAVEAEPMGIRVHYLLPYLTPETELGHSSIQIFARRAGVDEQTILERQEILPALTPAAVGEAVWNILTDPALEETIGFRISGRGLVAIGPEEAPVRARS